MKIRRPLFDFSSPDTIPGFALYFAVVFLMHGLVGVGWWRSIGIGMITQLLFYMEFSKAKYVARHKKEETEE